MHDLWPEIGKVGSWLIVSGTLGGAIRSLLTAVKKKRAGVSVRDAKRRLDLAGQLASAVANIHRLREYCIAHGSDPADLPALPDFLQEPA